MIFQLLTHIITLKVTGGVRGGYPKEDSIILQGFYLGEVFIRSRQEEDCCPLARRKRLAPTASVTQEHPGFKVHIHFLTVPFIPSVAVLVFLCQSSHLSRHL